jgi:hypothetical protein
MHLIKVIQVGYFILINFGTLAAGDLVDDPEIIFMYKLV